MLPVDQHDFEVSIFSMLVSPVVVSAVIAVANKFLKQILQQQADCLCW
jgi:hypothetical protein